MLHVLNSSFFFVSKLFIPNYFLYVQLFIMLLDLYQQYVTTFWLNIVCVPSLSLNVCLFYLFVYLLVKYVNCHCFLNKRLQFTQMSKKYRKKTQFSYIYRLYYFMTVKMLHPTSFMWLSVSFSGGVLYGTNCVNFSKSWRLISKEDYLGLKELKL